MKTNIQDKVKEASYFQNRGVGSDYMTYYKIPLYLQKVLPDDKNAKILDIGCGFGFVLKSVRECGYADIHGIDISDEAVSTCKKNGLNVQKITDLTSFFDTNKTRYDFVILTHVIEHIDKEILLQTLSDIKSKLLSPGGKLYLTTPNAQSNTGCYWRYEDFTHTTIFTSGSMIYALKSAGYNDIAFLDPNDTDKHSLPMKYLKLSLLKIFKLNVKFWNKVTGTSFHGPSPEIYTFELKVLAK